MRPRYLSFPSLAAVLRRVAALAVAAALIGSGNGRAWAHAGPRLTDPVAGATLGDTPKEVRLTFSERPEPKLSVIGVLDTSGTAYQVGPPDGVPGDPLSLAVRVRRLDRGVYTVTWRVVSAVDGHATAGAYAFGVRMTPAGPGVVTSSPSTSPLEMLARFVLVCGFVALLGAAAAGAMEFGGAGDLSLGGGGWGAAILGVLMLALAQWRNAAASFGHLLNTPVGRALIGRSMAILVAGAALLAARRAGLRGARSRRIAMAIAALAAMAGLAIHVASGHAAAAVRMKAGVIAAQWAHFTAGGIWLGGLAALLLGVRGDATVSKAAAVRRFSRIAAAGLFVVIATGILRAIGEVASWEELGDTGYGRAVLAKIALTVALAALGAFNHWRSVPVAPTSLRPLRRAGSGELVLSVGALAAAAMLGSLPTPAAERSAGFSVSGVDFGTTVRVELTSTSIQPGPNIYTLRAVDYDTGAPVLARRVSLRFTPLDDPGVDPTTLRLAPVPGGSFSGSGANMIFDGRWRLTALIERTGDAVEVPLEVESRGPPQFLSIERVPGKPTKYTVQVGGRDQIRISPDPERPGRSQLFVTCFDLLGDYQPIDPIVITSAAEGAEAVQAPVRRLDAARFVAEITLEPGRNSVAVVGRTLEGARLRASVDLEIPNP